MQINLYNSLSKKISPFTPLQENSVRMYSCGPTVYNYAHIGNMRAFLFADLLQRVMRIVGGYDVKWVMNITNIDDKTIRDSAFGSSAWLQEMGEQKDDPMENLLNFTEYYRMAFIDDISKLGIDSKQFFYMPKATEYIPQIQELIEKIVAKGLGYVSEGSVYFNLAEWRKIDIYGKLHKIDFDNFRSGARVDADQYEREQVSDFVLWKVRKPGEPYWKFEVNGQNCDGRPGWHIECSAMERELLGLPFDIHTGGIDLKFPHHEDEIAQSKAGYGVDPTAFWCHNEFLEVEGEKMSKSLGNFFTLRDLTDKGIDPADIRYIMLSAHYGSTLNFTFEGIASARKARLRIQDYIYDLMENENTKGSAPDVEKFREDVLSELANDLHTPKALAVVFTFINNNPVSALNRASSRKLTEFFKTFNRIFEVFSFVARPQTQITIPPEVIELAEKRLTARKEKNWAESDILRGKISELGYTVKDTKDSYSLEKT